MARRQRSTTQNNQDYLANKIDKLNESINDLVDVLEKLSTNTKNGNGGDNPFIRPGSRRTSSQRYRDRRFYDEWSQYY